VCAGAAFAVRDKAVRDKAVRDKASLELLTSIDAYINIYLYIHTYTSRVVLIHPRRALSQAERDGQRETEREDRVRHADREREQERCAKESKRGGGGGGEFVSRGEVRGTRVVGTEQSRMRTTTLESKEEEEALSPPSLPPPLDRRRQRKV